MLEKLKRALLAVLSWCWARLKEALLALLIGFVAAIIYAFPLFWDFFTDEGSIESLRKTALEAIIIFTVAVIGYPLTSGLTWGVKYHMNRKARKEPNVSYTQWEQLTSGVGGPGQILGALERIVFFLALRYDFELFIGAWLAFKVVAKWDAWANIVQVPSDDNTISLRLRRLLGGQVMISFLVGTLSNILVAGLGYSIAGFYFSKGE